ncbi:MAG TPA: ImcF-related family protein [Terriglobia bacterium]|nr:ImcF-related family protein [Terriglobia bacterium]
MTIKSLLFLLFLYLCLVWVGAVYLYSGPAIFEFGLLWTAIGLLALFVCIVGSHIFTWWGRWRARPAQPKAPKPAQVVHEDDAGMAALIAEANAALAKAPAFADKGTRAPLYSLPWYLLIGPEGSGKTSTFLNSGVEPQSLAGQVTGPMPSNRIGNFWLAKDAIFVEVSGKAFSGDSDRWIQLLRVLRGADSVPSWRRLLGTPENTLALRGVIGFSDVQEFRGASADPQRFEKYCRNWQERLRGIGEVFGVEFPVYHVITKCDEIPFFPDFFRQLPEVETGQVLGCTFPLHRIEASQPGEVFADAAVKRLTKAFRALYHSLAERRLTHLATETTPTRRPAIYEFPRELKRIRASLVQFLTDAFRPDPLRPGPLLRGYYLTAIREVEMGAPEPTTGPDEWKTLDSRSIRSVDATGMFGADAFGNSINRSINRPRQKRMVLRWSFVSELFHRIVLLDQPVHVAAPVDARWERFRRRVFVGACGVCGLLSLAFFISWLGNVNLLRDVEAAARARLQKQDDLASISDLQKLDALRLQFERLRNGPGWWLHSGLYAGNRILDATRVAYFRRFNDVLLTDLNRDMVRRLKALPATPGADDPYDPIYQRLKTHLMISAGTCPVEPVLVSHVLKEVRGDVAPKNGADWQTLADRQIDFYAGELPNGNPSPMLADDVARAQAQEYLRNITGVDQIYAAIFASAEKAFAKPQRLADVAPNYAQVLKGPDEISSVFTVDGWKFVEKASKERNSGVGESCVLGEGTERAPNATPAGSVAEAIQRRFARDYIDRWQKFVAGFSIVPYTNPADAARKLGILSSNTSPLLGLFSMTANQTSFPAGPLAALQKDVAGIVQKNTPGIVQKIEKAVSGSVEETKPQPTGPPGTAAEINQFFEPVHLVVAPGNGPWPSDKNKPYMDELAHLRTAMENIAGNSSDPAAIQEASKSYVNGLDVVRQISAPFKRDELSMDVVTLLEEPIELTKPFTKPPDVVGQINGKFRALCISLDRTLLRKFPFRPSTEDAMLSDLAAAFGPAGSVWKFRAEPPFGELTVKEGSQWKAKDPAQKPQVTPEILAFLNRAQGITTAFFPAGSTQPHLTYTLRPRLDSAFTGGILEVEFDGQLHQWTSVLQKQFNWPAAPGATSGAIARIRTGPTAYSFALRGGVWGIFRIMADAQPRALSSPIVEWKYTTLKDLIQPVPVKMEFADFPGGVDIFNPVFFSGLQCPVRAVQPVQ